MIDGAGVIDGGGQRWWEVRAAQQAGDREAAEFLSKTRHAATVALMLQSMRYGSASMGYRVQGHLPPCNLQPTMLGAHQNQRLSLCRA